MNIANTILRSLHLLEKTYTDWQYRGIRYATARLLEKTIERLDRVQTVAIVEDDRAIIGINRSWSNDYGIAIEGWLLSKQEPLQNVKICIGDRCVSISHWHRRRDVSILYPQYCQDDRCGFVVYIPRLSQHQVEFRFASGDRSFSKTVSFPGSQPLPPANTDRVGGLFEEFCQLVNDRHLHVLEIGSRIVGDNSQSRRSLFPNAASYTGFDYYPDDNTDVVGDAHQLSKYFGDRQFDAIFSLSVLEHLAMP